MKLGLCIIIILYEALLGYLHSTVNIMEIFDIVKGKTEDDVCSLLNLLYKFNYTWKYLEVAAGSYSNPA